jgi:hypothetical protein
MEPENCDKQLQHDDHIQEDKSKDIENDPC